MRNAHLVRVGLENLDNLPSAVVSDGLPASVLLVPSGRGGRVRLEPFFQFLREFHGQVYRRLIGEWTAWGEHGRNYPHRRSC